MKLNFRRDHLKRLAAAFLVSLLLIPFQNCSRSKFGTKTQPAITYSGNGDAYEGKLTRYTHTNRVCTELGANGQPLPERMIYLFGDYPQIRAQLVRENCVDLDLPVTLDVAQISFSGANGGGDLIYQGLTHQPLVVGGDFEVVASACPAGRTPLASSSRVNLLSASQNLADPAWFLPEGIATGLSGSLAGLPRYQILRDDPLLVDFWRRASQILPLPGGRTYSFTFLAKPGTSDWVGFSFYEAADFTFTLSVNLTTGQTRDDGNVGVPSVQTGSRSFGGGRMITVYFTTPRAAPNAAVGIYPSTPTGQPYAYGDSVFATAVQLEDTALYCAP